MWIWPDQAGGPRGCQSGRSSRRVGLYELIQAFIVYLDPQSWFVFLFLPLYQGVAVLEGHPEDAGELAPGLTSSRQRWLEELGYRVVSGGN